MQLTGFYHDFSYKPYKYENVNPAKVGWYNSMHKSNETPKHQNE